MKPKKVYYLLIDMNCRKPEIAAEYFWDRMTSGEAILHDDYGLFEHAAQKRAFDEFARKKKRAASLAFDQSRLNPQAVKSSYFRDLIK